MAIVGLLPSIYLYPYHHFWFLQALFVVFLLLVALEAMGALATLRRYCLVLGVSIACFLLLPDQGHFFFSLPQAVYILPFFLLGVGANRYQNYLLSNLRLCVPRWFCWGWVYKACIRLSILRTPFTGEQRSRWPLAWPPIWPSLPGYLNPDCYSSLAATLFAYTSIILFS